MQHARQYVAPTFALMHISFFNFMVVREKTTQQKDANHL